MDTSLPEEYGFKPEEGCTPHDLVIDILGTSFSITADEKPEYLNDILAQFKTAVANTQNISGMQDPLKVAILTGFLLCDEINKLKMETDRITEKLIARIDRVFDNKDIQ